MKHTDVYGLPYLEPDDFVRNAPAQFQETAKTYEKVLQQLDKRVMPAGVAPVTAATYEGLSAQTGRPGQVGYVSAATTDGGGMYVWADTWVPVATADTIFDILPQKSTTVLHQDTTVADNTGTLTYYVAYGVVTLLVNWRTGTVANQSGTCGTQRIPELYRPPFNLGMNTEKNGNGGAVTVTVFADGTVRWVNRGHQSAADSFQVTFTWPIAK